MSDVSRRLLLGTGAASVVGGLATTFMASSALADPPPDTFEALEARARHRGTDPRLIDAIYREAARLAGGSWHSRVALINPDGTAQDAVSHDPDVVIGTASVQKVAIAMAVMDKVDRGELSLGQRVPLTADIILGGSGIYHLQTTWGDDLTLANVLTAMLLVSDNTSVRLCGKLVPGPEINQIFAAKGLIKTRVEPLPTNPHRFYLGKTTPTETTDLLLRLVKGELLSSTSTAFLLGIMRGLNGYQDGVRRAMSSRERLRVVTKPGALDGLRHEVGVMFDEAGHPAVVYGFFADNLPDAGNYGGTHPAIRAHALLGRVLLSAADTPTTHAGRSDQRHTWPAPPVSFDAEAGG